MSNKNYFEKSSSLLDEAQGFIAKGNSDYTAGFLKNQMCAALGEDLKKLIGEKNIDANLKQNAEKLLEGATSKDLSALKVSSRNFKSALNSPTVDPTLKAGCEGFSELNDILEQLCTLAGF